MSEDPADGQGEWLAATLADQLGVDGPLPAAAVLAAAVHPRYHRQLIMSRDQPAALTRLLEAPPRVADAVAATLGMGPRVAGPGPAATPAPGPGSTAVLTRRATTAVVRWAASGFALADEPTRARRLAACAACPHWTDPPAQGPHRVTSRLRPGSRICGLCGCVTDLKVRLTSEACPAPHQADPALTRWGEPRMQHTP